MKIKAPKIRGHRSIITYRQVTTDHCLGRTYETFLYALNLRSSDQKPLNTKRLPMSTRKRQISLLNEKVLTGDWFTIDTNDRHKSQ